MTDIQGSTRLWEREPDAMRQALARHDAVVATCIRRQNGFVVKSKGEGDSVFAVFRHVRDAVTAALVIQCALNVERWATSTPIRVRMAVHTGRVDLREGDYYGPTVNRCARLRALAIGGQVLLSGVTAQLAQATLPRGASLVDLGSQQLKDLSAPERVWELNHPQMGQVVVAAKLAAPEMAEVQTRQAFKVTDHMNRDADGREWGAGVSHSDENGLRCYSSPMLAALLNPLHERFRFPRLWAASVDIDADPSAGIVECQEVTTLRQVALPTLAAEDFARFAVLCARVAYAGGAREAEFSEWADMWLGGMDSSGVAARALADTLEIEAQRGAGVTDPQEEMAANAARAAMHAARTAWMAGRAREEEIASAVALSAEAVRTALQFGHLDLAELSEEAVPRLAGARAA